MASPVVGLDGVVPVSSVLRLLRRTTHNGFPVLAPLKGDAEQGGASWRAAPWGVWGAAGGERGARQGAGRLQGLVLRSQVGGAELGGHAPVPARVGWGPCTAGAGAARSAAHQLGATSHRCAPPCAAAGAAATRRLLRPARALPLPAGPPGGGCL